MSPCSDVRRGCGSAARLADQARSDGWSHEDYLAAVLSREVTARESSGTQNRIRLAGFPTRKSLEDFNFDYQPSLSREKWHIWELESSTVRVGDLREQFVWVVSSTSRQARQPCFGKPSTLPSPLQSRRRNRRQTAYVPDTTYRPCMPRWDAAGVPSATQSTSGDRRWLDRFVRRHRNHCSYEILGTSCSRG